MSAGSRIYVRIAVARLLADIAHAGTTPIEARYCNVEMVGSACWVGVSWTLVIDAHNHLPSSR